MSERFLVGNVAAQGSLQLASAVSCPQGLLPVMQKLILGKEGATIRGDLPPLDEEWSSLSVSRFVKLNRFFLNALAPEQRAKLADVSKKGLREVIEALQGGLVLDQDQLETTFYIVAGLNQIFLPTRQRIATLLEAAQVSQVNQHIIIDFIKAASLLPHRAQYLVDLLMIRLQRVGADKLFFLMLNAFLPAYNHQTDGDEGRCAHLYNTLIEPLFAGPDLGVDIAEEGVDAQTRRNIFLTTLCRRSYHLLESLHVSCGRLIEKADAGDPRPLAGLLLNPNMGCATYAVPHFRSLLDIQDVSGCAPTISYLGALHRLFQRCTERLAECDKESPLFAAYVDTIDMLLNCGPLMDIFNRMSISVLSKGVLRQWVFLSRWEDSMAPEEKEEALSFLGRIKKAVCPPENYISANTKRFLDGDLVFEGLLGSDDAASDAFFSCGDDGSYNRRSRLLCELIRRYRQEERASWIPAGSDFMIGQAMDLIFDYFDSSAAKRPEKAREFCVRVLGDAAVARRIVLDVFASEKLVHLLFLFLKTHLPDGDPQLRGGLDTFLSVIDGDSFFGAMEGHEDDRVRTFAGSLMQLSLSLDGGERRHSSHHGVGEMVALALKNFFKEGDNPHKHSCSEGNFSEVLGEFFSAEELVLDLEDAE